VHALDVGAIDAALLLLVRAAGVEEEQAPRIFAGIEQALGARVDVDAAAGIAAADQVRVAVPDVARVEPLPCGADQLMIGEPSRQPRKTGVPQALLGPVAAGGEAAGEAGETERT
jgi:hypothetical protein